MCRRWKGKREMESRSKVVEKEKVEESKSPACEMRFLFAHAREREWDCIAADGTRPPPIVATPERGRHSSYPSLFLSFPLVQIAQSFTSAHCVSIVFFFSLRTAFLLPAYELPCVTSSTQYPSPALHRPLANPHGRVLMQLRAGESILIVDLTSISFIHKRHSSHRLKCKELSKISKI